MSRRTSATIVALTSLTVVGLVGFSAWAGPLNPPAGPVTGTHKTLTEVQPRTPIGPTTTPGDATATYIIGAPGCFYLTGNVTGQAGKDGIKVTANGPVTIDLNGFALLGVPASLNGFRVAGGNAIVGLYGGTIQGWGVNGLIADSGNHRIRDLVIRDNGGDGIHMVGTALIDCNDIQLWNNTGDGIEISAGGNLRNVSIKDNTAAGVRILASAMGVELDHVSISGSGMLISDAGSGTHFGPTDLDTVPLTGSSAVVLGPNATVQGMTLNVMGGTLSGPAIDASAAGISIEGLTIKATGATAGTLLTLGANTTCHGLSVNASNCMFSGAVIDDFALGNGEVALTDLTIILSIVTAPAAINGRLPDGSTLLVAKDCAFSVAIANITRDGSSGGGRITASGTTTAPSAIRIAASSCELANGNTLTLLTAGVPIGIDVRGASNTLTGAVVKGVPAGGTGIRIQTGFNGNQIDGCRVSGSGAGQITAISVAGNNNLVISNRINALQGGTAISNTGTGNVIGPTTNAANIATLTNPLSNIIH